MLSKSYLINNKPEVIIKKGITCWYRHRVGIVWLKRGGHWADLCQDRDKTELCLPGPGLRRYLAMSYIAYYQRDDVHFEVRRFLLVYAFGDLS